MMTSIRRAAAFLLCMLAFGAQAQALTAAQMASLRAGACADTATARPLMIAGDEAGVRAWLNETSAFVAWKTAVSRDDVTGDGFDWTQVDNLSVGQARIWDLIFSTQTGYISFAEPGKRAGITEAWKGTAAKVAVRDFVLNAGKRTTTHAERILATGTGTQATPGAMTFEGGIASATPIVFKDDGSLWGCP